MNALTLRFLDAQARVKRLEAEKERLRNALKFYAEGWEGHPGDSGPGGNTPADPDAWPGDWLMDDCGALARRTLNDMAE